VAVEEVLKPHIVGFGPQVHDEGGPAGAADGCPEVVEHNLTTLAV
jgi:hypothetical protein